MFSYEFYKNFSSIFSKAHLQATASATYRFIMGTNSFLILQSVHIKQLALFFYCIIRLYILYISQYLGKFCLEKSELLLKQSYLNCLSNS